MKKITYKNALLMIKGASILSCGGGISYDEQMVCINKLDFKQNIDLISIKDLSNVNKDSVFVTASEIGPADKPPINKTKIPQMIQLFMKKYKKNIYGIIPVEIGQESIVFDTALKSGLPVVDSDLAGLRAVPKASMNALIMQGINFTRSPLIVLTSKQEIICMNKNDSIEEDEIMLRRISKETNNVIFVIGGFIKAEMIQRFLKHKSLSTIHNIGKKIEKNDDFIRKIPLSLLFTGSGQIQRITNVNNSGFSEKEILISIKKQKHSLFTLTIKNEYMKFTNGQQIFQFPQLITIFDKHLNRGLSSSELIKKMNVQINVFKPLSFWDKFNLN